MKYETYAKIRDSKGYTDYRVSQETGIGRSTFSDWKSGRSTPKPDKIKKISECLEVAFGRFYDSNDEFLEAFYEANSDEIEQVRKENTITRIAQKMLVNDNLFFLCAEAADASDEDIQTVYQMLLALKKKGE